jgi:Flp pilus assembly protein TadB
MPDTAPRPEEPLNERELRELERIGEGLEAESPRLSTELRRGPLHRAFDDGLALLAVLVILGVLLPSSWFAVVMIVIAMGGPTLIAARLQRRR